MSATLRLIDEPEEGECCPTHGTHAREFTVRKEGVNKGRKFWRCTDRNCKFFKWSDGKSSAAFGPTAKCPPPAQLHRQVNKAFSVPSIAASTDRVGAETVVQMCLNGVMVQMKTSVSSATATSADTGGFKREEMPEIEWEIDPHMTQEQFLESLRPSPEKRKEIESARQRSIIWGIGRHRRLTFSNLGAACGDNPYCSRDTLVKRLVWSTPFNGNLNMDMGTYCEDIAVVMYESRKRMELVQREVTRLRQDPRSMYRQNLDIHVTVKEVNFMFHPDPELFWLGGSPDGAVYHRNPLTGQDELVGGLEIKTRLKGWYDPPNRVTYDWQRDPELAHIPVQYYAQMQGEAQVLQVPWIDFVELGLEKGMRVTRVPRNQEFWDTVLLPKAKKFYFEHFLPSAVLRIQGKLERGQICVSMEVDLDSGSVTNYRKRELPPLTIEEDDEAQEPKSKRPKIMMLPLPSQ